MGVMDLREKKSEVNETQKSCSDCKTTKTPLWRGGPAGPKSLCNACGIKFRKKRRVIEDPNRASEKEKKKKKKLPSQSITTSSSTEDNSADSHENGLSRNVKMRLFFLGSEVLLHTSSSSSVIVKKQRRKRKLGEEELAAVSLMALSCGAVFA